MGKTLEYLGLAIFIGAFIITLLSGFIEKPWMVTLEKYQDIMYWLGLGMWAFGYLLRGKK